MSEHEFTYPFQIDKLGPNPKRLHVEASPEDIDFLCAMFELNSMSFFKGQVVLERLSGKKIEGKFSFSTKFIQECVVTGKDVITPLSVEFSRIYDQSIALHDQESEIDIDIESDEEIDPIIDGTIDIAAAMIEELGLEVNPFPRLDESEFEDYGIGPEITEEEVKSNNPFAVLEKIKNKSEK